MQYCNIFFCALGQLVGLSTDAWKRACVTADSDSSEWTSSYPDSLKKKNRKLLSYVYRCLVLQWVLGSLRFGRRWRRRWRRWRLRSSHDARYTESISSRWRGHVNWERYISAFSCVTGVAFGGAIELCDVIVVNCVQDRHVRLATASVLLFDPWLWVFVLLQGLCLFPSLHFHLFYLPVPYYWGRGITPKITHFQMSVYTYSCLWCSAAFLK